MTMSDAIKRYMEMLPDSFQASNTEMLDVEIVRDALIRIGHFDFTGEVPMTASPSPYGYRNRARLLQSGTAVGYRMRRSHRVCGVTQCPVLNAPLERALGRLAATAKSNRSTLQSLLILPCVGLIQSCNPSTAK